jgi:tRNA(fMet)-specific endonuclease VapC
VKFEFVLDTNIISEFTKPKPDEKVLQFLDKEKDNFCICAPVYQEIVFGIELLPTSKKKTMYLSFLKDIVDSLEVLHYDEASARIHAKLRAEIQKKGKILPYIDTEIASICIRNNSTLATKNVKDYKGIKGLKLKIF